MQSAFGVEHEPIAKWGMPSGIPKVPNFNFKPVTQNIGAKLNTAKNTVTDYTKQGAQKVTDYTKANPKKALGAAGGTALVGGYGVGRYNR